MFNLTKCPRCGHRLNMQPREEVRQDYPNAFAPWTSADDKKLEEMFMRGESRLAMTEALQRQLGAIIRRIEKLGLVREPVTGPPALEELPEGYVPPKPYVASSTLPLGEAPGDEGYGYTPPSEEE